MKRTFLFNLIQFVVISSMLTLTAPATPQSPPNININPSLSSNNVQRGRTVRATVVMDIPSGYHIHSNKPLEKFLIATQLSVETPRDLKGGVVSYPRPVLRKFKFSKSQVSVYEGRAIMRFNVTVPQNVGTGSKEIKLKLRYQACNDDVCFPPQTKNLSLWLNVQ